MFEAMTLASAVTLMVLASSIVIAGPTADRLRAMGSDVIVPKAPPLGPDAARQIKGNPVGPIDGGEDKPPYQLEKVSEEQSAVTTPETKPDNTEAPEGSQSAKDLAKNTSAPEPVEAAGSPSACLVELKKIAEANAAAEPDADIDSCVIDNPVILVATKGKNAVKFSSGLLLDCSFARYLAKFTADVVQPLAQFHMGKSIEQVQSGQGFVCRRRNNALNGKLSEHAFGNATDWVGFKFDDGQQLEVKADELVKPPQADFLNAVRAAGCGYFTTVLGPGSDPAHATHFHFDRGRTEGKKNPYRICE